MHYTSLLISRLIFYRSPILINLRIEAISSSLLMLQASTIKFLLGRNIEIKEQSKLHLVVHFAEPLAASHTSECGNHG